MRASAHSAQAGERAWQVRRPWRKRLTCSSSSCPGGVLYVVGAVIYASGKPNPWPRVFGYHEVFHALVLAAAALQYAVIAFAVLPRG